VLNAKEATISPILKPLLLLQEQTCLETMMQVYIDDSGKSDQSPVLVLAGYLASDERWQLFDARWNTILALHGMTNFHAVDVWRLGYSSGVKSPLVRSSVFVQLLNCITQHVEHAFAVSIPLESHEHWFASKQFPEYPELRVYNMAFYGLLTQIHQHMFKRHFDKSLEIMFDEQGGESAARILGGMEEFAGLAAGGFPNLKVATPKFMSDNGCPGLQAADMLAWLLRRDALNAYRQIDRHETAEALMLGEALSMPHSIKIWTDDDLRRAADDVLNRLRSSVPDAS